MRRTAVAGLAALVGLISAGCSLLDGGQQPPAPSPVPTSAPSPGATPTTSTAPAPASKALLLYKPKKGTTLAYRVRTNIVNNAIVNAKSQKILMSQVVVFAYKIVAVGASGDSTVKVTYRSAIATIDGRRVTPPLVGKTVTLVVSPRGQVKEIKSLGGLASSEGGDYRRIFDDVPAPLPDRPVGVGDTWDSTADVVLPDGSGTISTHVTYKLAGIRKIGNERVAIVRSNFTQPVTLTLTKPDFILDVASQARGSGTEYFSLRSARMLKATAASNVVVRQIFHVSGLGLPIVNSTQRIRLQVFVNLIRQSTVAGSPPTVIYLDPSRT